MYVGIVGAGISGLLAGLNLSRIALVDIYERAKDVGARKHCTGIVSLEAISRIKARKFIESCFNELVFFIGNVEVRFYSSKYFACRISREAHEKYLANELRSSGCNLKLRSYVLSVENIGKKYCIKYLSNGVLNKRCYDYVIIAEGYPNKLSNSLGFRPKIEVFRGLQYRLYLLKALPKELLGKLMIHYGLLGTSDFSWVVPLNRREVLVGLISSLDGYVAIKLLDIITNRFMKVLGTSYTCKELIGGIALRGYCREFCIGNSFSIGDANAMVKSLSCGGLYPISIAVEALTRVITKKDYELANKLIRYLRSNYLVYRIISNYLVPLCRSLHRKVVIELKIDSSMFDNYFLILRKHLPVLGMIHLRRRP